MTISSQITESDHRSMQWLCLTFIMAGLPLLLFPRFFRRLAGLDEIPRDSVP